MVEEVLYLGKHLKVVGLENREEEQLEKGYAGKGRGMASLKENHGGSGRSRGKLGKK